MALRSSSLLRLFPSMVRWEDIDNDGRRALKRATR